MKNKVEQVKNNIEAFLKEDSELKDYHVCCVLINPSNERTITLASDESESLLLFTPYTTIENGYNKNCIKIPDWDFSFDNYIFEALENDYFVGYMSDDMNYGIWNSLDELYPNDIEHKVGVQSYLQYCADNGISKVYLKTRFDMDILDVMQYFEGLSINDLWDYEGIIIEPDDLNYDNPKETIVNIYKNKEAYLNGDACDVVSLNTIALKQNVKDYINEHYLNKLKNSEMEM